MNDVDVILETPGLYPRKNKRECHVGRVFLENRSELWHNPILWIVKYVSVLWMWINVNVWIWVHEYECSAWIWMYEHMSIWAYECLNMNIVVIISEYESIITSLPCLCCSRCWSRVIRGLSTGTSECEWNRIKMRFSVVVTIHSTNFNKCNNGHVVTLFFLVVRISRTKMEKYGDWWFNWIERRLTQSLVLLIRLGSWFWDSQALMNDWATATETFRQYKLSSECCSNSYSKSWCSWIMAGRLVIRLNSNLFLGDVEAMNDALEGSVNTIWILYEVI